jgi:TatD DNase family protein
MAAFGDGASISYEVSHGTLAVGSVTRIAPLILPGSTFFELAQPTRWAQAGGKILSIHSVRAAPKVLDLIEEEIPEGRAKFVFHWFTGSSVDARRAAGLGCYFSINSPMLLTDRGRALVSSLPIDRLLTETDGPFTAQGGGPARPRDVGQTVRSLATARGLSSEETAAVVLRNLRTLTT